MCTEPPCENGFLIPSGDARVPANAPGLWWRAARESDAAAGEALRVLRVDAGAGEGAPAELSVTRTWRAEPGGVLVGVPLEAGQRLRVEAADTCVIGGRRPFVANLEVGPAAPVPTRLGTLWASEPVVGPLTLASDGGGCSAERTAVYVDVQLTPDAGAEPWADLLLYETRVDGELYRAAASSIHAPPPHESWLGRGRDRLFVVCDEEAPARADGAQGLASGAHRVQLLARLPGVDAAIESEPLTLTLRCPPGAEPVAPAAELYDLVSFQTGAVVVAAQLALVLYFVLTRRKRRRPKR